MDIVTAVKDYVEFECKKPTSHYGYEPFTFHFTPMVRYAIKLADELGANKEIVEIAGWLHDIGAIVEGRDNHHITGSEIAEKKLHELNYPDEKIEIVKKCILGHRGSQKNVGDSLEEKVVAEADILSNFENISGIFKAAYIFEGLDQGQAQTAAKKKLQNKYNQLQFEASKKIIKPKYEAAMLLLS